jgi:hypothetical protein
MQQTQAEQEKPTKVPGSNYHYLAKESSYRGREEDAEVVLSQRAYCIITAQPVHTVVFKVPFVHAKKQENYIVLIVM